MEFGLAEGYRISGKNLFAANVSRALPGGTYTIGKSMDGFFFSPTDTKSDEIVPIPNHQSSMVVRELEEFWKQASAYRNIGALHRRGYLLHGPPGVGKTSTINAIADSVIGAGGVVFYFDGEYNASAVGRALQIFRSTEPDRPCLLVMEDLDSLITAVGEKQLLSLLDGEGTIDKCVVLATTNYVENLPDRFVNRPGRFDRVVEVTSPSDETRRAFLEAKAKDKSLDLDSWVELTDGFSIAHLKEALVGSLINGESDYASIRRVRSMNNISSDRVVTGF